MRNNISTGYCMKSKKCKIAKGFEGPQIMFNLAGFQFSYPKQRLVIDILQL